MRRAGGGMEHHSVFRKRQHQRRHLSIIPKKPLGDGSAGGEELLDFFGLWQ
jgi:hypothetical protein